MPTPPRSRLPTSSPSSARLRRLAPSPVKVPPPPLAIPTRPPLPPTPSSSQTFACPPSPEDPFEYDFCPLESLASPGQLDTPGWRAPAAWRTAGVDTRVPVMLDEFGTYARLAKRQHDEAGPDVPESSDAARRRRSADSLMSPAAFYAAFHPRPVLVEFRDVFAPALAPATMPVSPRQRTPSPLLAPPPLSPVGPGREPRMVRDDSVGTFGPLDRRPSTDTVDDGWSYTLSAYGDDDESREAPTSPPATSAPATLALPELDDSTSPASCTTDIVTPDADDIDLPPRTASVSSETPTPKSRQYVRSSGGLGLSLGPPDLAPPSACPSDLCPSPSATLVSPVPPIIFTHSRTPTLDKALPRLPAPSPPRGSALLSPTLVAAARETTVHLWVGQDGVRDVRSTLRFVRTHRAEDFRERELRALEEAAKWCESPTKPEPFQQAGCIEYGMDPRERDRWIFHHAHADNLPVLRRLTINGDDKYDFLAREATLHVKEPGVYAVTGSEDRGRAEYKFSYLVTPRISSKTGELIPDEKMVVPLALYVSPNFFDPERASKAHLYHVFKKSLAANVASVKVRPPHIGKPPTPSPVAVCAGGEALARTPTPPSPVAPLQPVISRTIGAIAKVMSTTTPGPSPVHKFGTRTPAANKAGRVRTPTGPDAPADEEAVKGRRRARSLFSRQRPFTPPASQAAAVPPLPPLAPMKSMSSLRPMSTDMRASTRVRHAPSASMSTHSPSSPHPFATQVIPIAATPASKPSTPSTASTVASPGVPQPQAVLITRTDREWMLSVPAEERLQANAGLSPAPRGPRKRPSTAEPRLGMGVAAFGAGRGRVQ